MHKQGRDQSKFSKEIDVNTLGEFYSRYISCYRHQVMLSSLYHDYTYGEIDQHVHALAFFMKQKLRLKAGDRIAIMMPNTPQFAITFWAAQLLGLITVAVNPLYTSQELAHILNDSEVRAIMLWDAKAYILEAALPELKQKPKVILSAIGDTLTPIRSWIVNFVFNYLKRQVPSYSLPKHFKFSKILKTFKGKQAKMAKVNRKDIALLQYTGGTTGKSKGVMLSHANILDNISQSLLPYAELGLTGQERQLLILPMFHIYGLCIYMVSIFHGGHSIMIANPRNIPQVVNDIAHYKPNSMPLLNTLMVHLLRNKQFLSLDFSWLKVTMTGGMATHVATAHQWKDVTGCVVNQGYGLSETSPIISITRFKNKDEFINSVGFPVEGTQIKICNSSGKPVKFGKDGELWVKGPQVMQGYWKNKKATKAVIQDGWFKTGDIVKMSKNGEIEIVDRVKDMIIISGFNVYPSEVEMALTQHEKIAEAAVVGTQALNGNEAVKAYIVSRCPLSLGEVRKHCKMIIAGYKIPTQVEFVKELPKSTVGKVLRKDLKKVA